MTNLLVLTKDKINKDLETALLESNEFLYEVISPKKLSEKDLNEYSILILDTPKDSANKLISQINYSKILLVCLDANAEPLSLDDRDFDVIYKPVKKDELIIRLKNLSKINQLKQDMAVKSVCDELTGLYNRNYLMNRLEEELSRAIRHNKPISCMLVDVDYFKVINDVYGYKGGDSVLKQLAQILRKHVRKEDIITRYGDAQFVVVLPDTGDDNAFVIAERIRKDVRTYQFFNEDEPMTVTISIGISVHPSPHMDSEVNTLVRYAEHALFNCKKQGKNKVLKFSDIKFEF